MTQVQRDHYFKNYDSIGRFSSYFYQVDAVIKSKPEKVLEIGIGNKTVANYLKEFGFDLTTYDFDQNLNPDVVGDIRKLPFHDNEFDTVMACEVLEHIPFEDFEKALLEMRRVSKKNVIISIPYSGMHLGFYFSIAIPFFKKKTGFIVKIPYFFVGIEINEKNKEHYWEMGRKKYPRKKIKNIIKKHFNILRDFFVIHSPNHYFFILEKK